MRIRLAPAASRQTWIMTLVMLVAVALTPGRVRAAANEAIASPAGSQLPLGELRREPVADARARSAAKDQVQFGIRVAQHGLWKEALARWKRATEIDPTYAAAYNNLAIAYEQEGRLDEAREAYDKSLLLEPNNAMIRQNYELFKDINDRTDRRRSP